MPGQAAHKLTDAQPADIRKSDHGQQPVAPLAALAPQLPAHRAGLSPSGSPRGENIARETLCRCERRCPESAYIMAHTDFERMVVEELKSIETGATEPIAYINANHYTQHNLGVADGLAGFGAALSALKDFPEAAKVNTVRVFQDDNFIGLETLFL